MDLQKNDRELGFGMESKKLMAQRSRGIRESLYSNIRVSVRTMNIIICVLALLLILSIAIGVGQGR